MFKESLGEWNVRIPHGWTLGNPAVDTLRQNCRKTSRVASGESGFILRHQHSKQIRRSVHFGAAAVVKYPKSLKLGLGRSTAIVRRGVGHVENGARPDKPDVAVDRHA